jgi:hypothetical protein
MCFGRPLRRHLVISVTEKKEEMAAKTHTVCSETALLTVAGVAEVVVVIVGVSSVAILAPGFERGTASGHKEGGGVT